MEAMVIRTAEKGDLVSLLRLLEMLFSIEDDFNFKPERQLIGLKLLTKCDSSEVFIAVTNNTIVGMITAQIVISTAEGEPSLLVEDLVVDSEWRGKMIGRELLNTASDWGKKRGARRLQLLADRNNTSALDFYKKNGWNKTNLICLRKFISEGE